MSDPLREWLDLMEQNDKVRYIALRVGDLLKAHDAALISATLAYVSHWLRENANNLDKHNIHEAGEQQYTLRMAAGGVEQQKVDDVAAWQARRDK